MISVHRKVNILKHPKFRLIQEATSSEMYFPAEMRNYEDYRLS